MNLKHLALAGVTLFASAALVACCCKAGASANDVLANLPFEMPEVPYPAIPDRSVDITDFGAVPDGSTLCTQAFADAIEHLSKQGGGRVVVPAGVWYTGPIVLKDNIELHLEQSALIYFSDDKSLYPLTEITF